MRFDELDLEEEILQGIEAMNFQEMTPVQEQTIPIILEGKDIIGCAQTGTGKQPPTHFLYSTVCCVKEIRTTLSGQLLWFRPGNWPNR